MLVHDMFQVSGNSLDVPTQQFQEIERQMVWDEHVRFVGYWEVDDLQGASGTSSVRSTDFSRLFRMLLLQESK